MQTYDDRPKRRLFELLKSQGMQENQQVVFLSDGGEDVRNLQVYLNPQAEHLLDWFHITMRLTVLRQQALGVNANETLETIERIKHYLWHGNVFQALQHIEFLQMDLDCIEDRTAKLEKLEQGVPTFLPTFKTIVFTFLTTVSVPATMKRSAPVSWSQPSIRSSVNGS